jgi:uncharacterized membrane protein YuzA (DUF378 family)
LIIVSLFFAYLLVEIYKMEKKHAAVWLDIIMRTLIVVGALNWGLIGFFDFNLVEWVSDRTMEHLDTVVYCLVGISALFYFFARDYYLPFLARAVYPCGSLAQKTPDNADLSTTIKVEPHVNVVYWAARGLSRLTRTVWLSCVCASLPPTRFPRVPLLLISISAPATATAC